MRIEIESLQDNKGKCYNIFLPLNRFQRILKKTGLFYKKDRTRLGAFYWKEDDSVGVLFFDKTIIDTNNDSESQEEAFSVLEDNLIKYVSVGEIRMSTLMDLREIGKANAKEANKMLFEIIQKGDKSRNKTLN